MRKYAETEKPTFTKNIIVDRIPIDMNNLGLAIVSDGWGK